MYINRTNKLLISVLAVLLLALGSLGPLGVRGVALRWQRRRAETSG